MEGSRGKAPARPIRRERAMEQIYYTQCPVGYGLGASNGFQVKRLSPGYPLVGDFRHFGLRAFIPSTRALAPTVLRYRIAEDGAAEVASLSPRSHEYETERGRWGRPGGHFAHGLRLGAEEISAIGHWPAGLHGRPFWRTSDPQPTLGRTPDPVDLGPISLLLAPTFVTLATVSNRWGVAELASLLSALAACARDGRTLYLIDRPDRLADDVSLLTLAFPERLRGELSFSTYHDRPEELVGFRIQGTAADPRLNRAGLLANGFVADLTAGLIEPKLDAAAWATTLAGWIVRNQDDDRAAWEGTNRLASQARSPEPPSSVWADEWLDRLHSLPAALTRTDDPPDWRALADLAEWARGTALSGDLAESRGPAWWRERAESSDASRRALVDHLGLLETWQQEGRIAEWGAVVADWLDRSPPEMRDDLFRAALHACPEPDRPGFLRALVASASGEVARGIARRVRSGKGTKLALLLPLEVKGAVEEMARTGTTNAVDDVLRRAAHTPASLPAVLEAVAAEASSRPDLAPTLHRLVSEQMHDRSGRAFLDWALRAAAPDAWLGHHFQAISARPDALHAWSALHDQIEPELHPALARAALDVAARSGIRDEVVRWCVESMLLTLPEASRPHDPRWPGLYLDRTPSGLDLMRRLFGREFRRLGVKRWLDDAKGRGELSAEHAARVEGCVRYARALKAGDARALLRVDLPVVPASERGAILEQVLIHVGTVSDDAFGTALDTCRAAWPDGFRPGADGLPGLAEPISERLSTERAYPDVWLGRLEQVLGRLGITISGRSGFEPDSFAAFVIAASTRGDCEGSSAWRLREFVLADDKAWRALAEDVRQHLEGRSRPEAIAALDEWDRHLAKGLHTARFFEVWLNASGKALAWAVAARAGDLRTLPDLPWWDHARYPGSRDDLREGFARFAPIAPIAEEALPNVQAWMRRPIRSSTEPGRSRPSRPDAELAPIEGEPVESRMEGAARSSSPLSQLGLARWRCIEALTSFYRSGVEADGCWQSVAGWTTSLPLDQLEPEDQILFVSWLIPRLDEPDSLKIARLAAWLVRSGMTEPDRITGWAERLEPFCPLSSTLKLGRAALVGDLRSEWRTVLREREERRS